MTSPEPKTLEETIAKLDQCIEMARHYAHGQTYYRELLVEIGEIIGRDAYIADDGSRSPDVLVAKLPDLIRKLIDDNRPKARPFESYL